VHPDKPAEAAKDPASQLVQALEPVAE